ncbi:MAG: thiol-disulfide oxidoreductase DCC family protein [Cyanobium sp.]
MASLTILYDGGCPLCQREVTFLRRRDGRLHPGAPQLAFVDIDDPSYEPADHAGISYRDAMGRIHALASDGAVLQDVEVFRRAYQLVGLGWLYAPTRWPLLRTLVDRLYALWASARLRLTRRPDLETLCSERQQTCRSGACPRP